MRLAVCSGLWKRFELAPPWWRGVQRLREIWQAAGHVVEVVVSGSEPEHQALARQYGATWVDVPNSPLGRKHNAMAQAAFAGGADYLLRMDADGFLAPSLAQQYLACIDRGDVYVGLDRVYYYDLPTGRTCVFGYPPRHRRYQEPLGHGRLLHRSLVPDGRPWEDHRERSLDLSMTRKLCLPPATLLAVDVEAIALNVTTHANIWSFDQVVRASGADPLGVDPPWLETLPEWHDLHRLRVECAA